MTARASAGVGTALGLAAGFGLTARLVAVQAESGRAGVGWAVLVSLALLAPFALALLGFALDAAGPLWMGAGFAAFLLVFTSPAGVTLVLLPGAGLLIAAGVLASRSAEPSPVEVPVAFAPPATAVATLVGVYTSSAAVSFATLGIAVTVSTAVAAALVRRWARQAHEEAAA